MLCLWFLRILFVLSRCRTVSSAVSVSVGGVVGGKVGPGVFCGATLHFGRWVSVPHLAELIRGPTRVVHRVPGGEGGGVSGPT